MGKSFTGFTLMEMCLAMMIIAVLSVGVSGLIRAGTEAQMAERTNLYMQQLSNAIVDDLRMDFRQADSANVTGGGNTLTLAVPSGTVTYQLTNGQFSRRPPSGASKVYNAKMFDNLEVACAPVCFKEPTNPALINSSGEPRQIEIPVLEIKQKKDGGSIIDRTFSQPNYKVYNFAFDVASATEFE